MMKVRRALALFVLFGSLGLATSRSAQEPAVKLEANLVTVPVIVQNKKGELVAGMTAKDFEIWENGRQQPIEFFSTEQTELLSRPLAVVFALDSSGSAAQTIRQQRAAAEVFLRQLSADQLVAVTRFSATADTLVDFTTDRGAIEDAFGRHIRLTGKTSIFDGVLYAIQKFVTLKKEDRDRRRVVILITDGIDNASFLRKQDVAAAAEDEEANIYIIYLPLFVPGSEGRLEPRKTAPGFTELALETGGLFFQVGDVRSALDPSFSPDLSGIFEKIVQELRSQYYIGYYPGDTNFRGEFRKIQVKVRARNVKVRQLKRGYYARSDRTAGEARRE